MRPEDFFGDSEKFAFDLAGDLSEILPRLDRDHLALLARVARGEQLFGYGVAPLRSYDFGPGEPVDAAQVNLLLELCLISFYTSPFGWLATPARLTPLGKAAAETFH